MKLENIEIGKKINLNLVEAGLKNLDEKVSVNKAVYAGTHESNWHYFIREQKDGEYIIEYKFGGQDVSLINEERIEISEGKIIQRTYKPRNPVYDYYKILLIKANLWGKNQNDSK